MLDLLEDFAVSETREPKQGLFIAGQFRSEVPNEINILPKPGVYVHSVYGKVVVTKEKNQEFINNFNSEIYQRLIPIDLEHETQLSGACGYFEPNSGRIDEFGAAWVKVRWEDRGAQALREGRFYYFSPTWFDKWRDPLTNKVHNNILIGGALTNSPYFKEKALKPLYASELKMEDNENGAGGNGGGGELTINLVTPSGTYTSTGTTGDNTFTFSFPDGIITGGNSTSGSKMEDKDKTETVDPVQFKEMQDRLAKFEELEAKANRFAEIEEQLKKANEELAKQAVSTRKRKFTEIVRGIDAEGDGSKKFKGSPEVHVTVLEALSLQFGEDSDEFQNYVNEMRSLSEQLDASDLLKEKGGTGESIPDSKKIAGEAAIDKWFEELGKTMSEKKLDEMEASKVLARDNKDLYDAYRKASYKRGED